MRIILTAFALVASAALTAVSVTTLPFFSSSTAGPQLLMYTLALWGLFALAFFLLRRVPVKAAVVLVLAGSVAIGGAAMAGPPNTSTDSARYAWDGIVQNAGVSPYDYSPTDPALASLRPQWLFPAPIVDASGAATCEGSRIQTSHEPGTDTVVCTALNRGTVPTIYPPTSELLFAGVRFLTGPTAQYWPLQLVGLLASLGITLLLLRALRRRDLDPRWAALWGWSPLVATEAITNSHVDVIGALLLLVATLLVTTGRSWLAGIALGAGIAVKLLPALGAPALLRRHGWKIALAAIGTFAVLYIPYVLASGIRVLGYLPGYLSEEGYETGSRFVLLTLFAPGPAATVLAAVLLVVLAIVVWRASDPVNPWAAQALMIGGALLIVSPRYPWYALLLVPMIAMSGRWEWFAVALALELRMLVPVTAVTRVSLALALIVVVVVSLRRSGPGALGRVWERVRHPFFRKRGDLEALVP